MHALWTLQLPIFLKFGLKNIIGIFYHSPKTITRCKEDFFWWMRLHGWAIYKVPLYLLETSIKNNDYSFGLRSFSYRQNNLKLLLWESNRQGQFRANRTMWASYFPCARFLNRGRNFETCCFSYLYNAIWGQNAVFTIFTLYLT